jgi:hypothetical protein
MNACIFCGSSADSKEDMFPQWILRRVKTGQPMVHKKPNRPIKISQSSKVRLKCVCATCNNGWMSALEQKCVPLIGALLEDIELWLDEEYQNLLSRWAVKTAMINDTVQSHASFFTRSECENLKNKQEIPFATQVCVGRFVGRSLDANGSDFTLLNPQRELIAQGHVFHVMVGHLILEVVSMHPVKAYEAVTCSPKFSPTKT